MNHIYKVIWNTITQTWVAVSELSRAKGKTKSSKTLSAVVLAAVSAGAIVGDAEAAALTGDGSGIAIQSQPTTAPYGAFARADAATSTAIGYLVVAESDHALAIGSQTQAIGEKTVAIGHLSKATGNESAAFGVNATAAGNGDIALGKHAVAQGGAKGITGSAAVGDEAKATGAQSAAVGGKANASGSHALASGYNTQATGGSSSAIGDAAEASGNQSTAVGVSSEAKGNQSAALGMQAHAHGSGSIAAGVASQATQNDTTAIGGWTEANAEKATAVGNLAKAKNNQATALGHDAQATGEFSTATGVSSRASGSASVATGKNATASGDNTIATGNGSNAAGADSIASGRQASATGTGAIATGAEASASGNAAAYGNKANATGGWSSAFGNESKATATDASAFGNSANAGGVNSTAIGSHSTVTANNGSALGNYAIVSAEGGVALGQGSSSSRTALNADNVHISDAGTITSSTGISDNDIKNNNNHDVYAPVKLINDPSTLERVKNTIKGTAGAVSLGNDTTTRQLTNLAPGSADSDAVNVAQLKAVVGTIKHYNVISKDGDITVSPDTTDPNNTVWDLKINPKYKIKYFSVKSAGGTNENNDGATGADAIAIGKDTTALRANAIAIGHEAKAQGYQNDIAIGYKAATNSEKSVAIGDNAKTDAGYSIALGTNATATVKNGIALGSESKASINNGQTGFDASQDVDGARVNKYTNLTDNNQNVRTSTLAGLSIGDAAKTRQINHLAAGKADDDAVNVAQLKSVNLAFKGNSGSGDVRLHDQRLSVVGAADSFITTTASDKKLEITTTQGTFSTTDGKLSSSKQGLATTTAVASAINESGWEVQAKGTKVGLVNPGDKVNFTNADKSIEIDYSAEASGLSTIKFKAVTETIQTEEKSPITQIDVNGSTVSKTTKGENKPTGRFVVPTGDKANKYALATAYDVADKVNQTGWNLYTNGGARSLINPGDYVNFKSGNATNATVVTEASEGATISYDVNVDNTTIKINPENKLTANTVDLTVNKTGDKAGTVGTPEDADKGKLVTAENVAKAVNESYWVAKKGDRVETNADTTSDDSNVTAGSNVTFVAGKNIALQKDGNKFIYATKDNVTFTDVTTNNFTVNANGNVDMGGNQIHNVGEGTAETDAVNVKQLNESISTESVIKKAGDDNIAEVAPGAGHTLNGKGAQYEVSVSKAKVREIAKEAVKVNTSTASDNPITVTPHTENGNITYAVNVNKTGLSSTTTDGKITVPTDSGLVTAKDVANAINSAYWKLNVGDTDVQNVKAGDTVKFVNGKGTTVEYDNTGKALKVNANVTDITAGNSNITVDKGNDGKYTISATDTNTQASVSNATDSPITIDSTGTNSAGAKDYKLDVNVDGTTITKTGGVLKAVIPAVEKVDLTVNKTGDKAGTVGTPEDADKGKLVTAENVAKAVNESYWVAKKGDRVETNADTTSDDSNVTAGSNVTFVAGKNIALQKDGNKFIYATKDNVTFTDVTTNNFTVNANGNVDMGGNQIHNVGEGTAETDAVNVKQLKAFKTEVGGYGWNLSVNNGKDASKITKDTTVDLNNDDGNIKIAKNGSNVTLSLGPDVGLGKAGKDGKDGSLAVRGKDGASVEISGKDGSIGLTGPKGKDGTLGASATITVEKGTTTVNDDRDGEKQVNRIVYTDKDKNGNDIKREVATLDDGLKFKGDSKEVINRTLGSQMNITGGADENKLTDKNIGVVYDKDTNGLKVKLSKDVNLGDNGTITIGDTVVNKDGLTINGGPSVTKGGVNAGNQSVTNVKDGTADNDAVNVKQLKAAKTKVEAGENIEITSRTDKTNGQTIYKVSAKGINDTSAAVKAGSNHVEVTKAANTHKDGSTTVTDYTVDLSDETKNTIRDTHNKVTNEGLTFNADHGTTGVKKLGSKVAVNGDGKNITTTADENGVKVSMKDDIKVNSVTAKEVKVGDVNINENGINAGGKRITNVAPGKDGTDAVNVNQLKYVAGNISNQINNVDKGLRAGIAGALASGGLYHVTTAGKSMVSVGAGTYRGQNALAVGYSRLSDNGKVGVKFTVNSNSQGHAGASASVGYQW